MQDKEIWKRIEWSPDYEVSNYGRVKSYKYDKINGRLKKLTQRKTGYITVQLPNIQTGKKKFTGVHRLVAEAFIPNHENKGDVNHIDEDKSNNHVDNLEWMTRKENINYGTARKRGAIARSKKIKCVETGKIYSSLKEAKEETGLYSSSISMACKGHQKTAGGYHWQYVD